MNRPALSDLPDWPAAMTREAALAYTGVAETQLAEWEKAGTVRFRPRGPHGALIAQKIDLDRALRVLFGGSFDDEGGHEHIEL